MFHTKSCRDNKNTHFVFGVFYFKNRAVCEIMWENIEVRGRPQVTVRRMRIACLIHTKVVIFIFTHMHR